MNNENAELTIEQFREGNKLTCRLSGWLDPNTSPDLINKIDLTEVKELIFDMKNVEYVFSSGLRSFLMLQKSLEAVGGTLRLINVSDGIRSIFEYTGFSSMLEVKA